MSSVPKKSREMKRVDSSQIYDEKKNIPDDALLSVCQILENNSL